MLPSLCISAAAAPTPALLLFILFSRAITGCNPKEAEVGLSYPGFLIKPHREVWLGSSHQCPNYTCRIVRTLSLFIECLPCVGIVPNARDIGTHKTLQLYGSDIVAHKRNNKYVRHHASHGVKCCG